jgi:putative heme-binding domain-containing protein
MRIRIGFLFIVAAITCYWLASWISSLPKTSAEFHSHESVNATARNGEELFWGSGRCHVCHRVGDRGYALRGPNLGKSAEGDSIGLRAQQRAADLNLRNGAEYLVQSLTDPHAFVTPNFKNEMPKIQDAPISLSAAEITAVILYLQTLGGTEDMGAIKLPRSLQSGAKSATSPAIRIRGNVEAGRSLFFDAEKGAGCASCHVAVNKEGEQEGGAMGPELTALASYRSREHIYWKILRPDSNVVSGYEEMLIKTKDDRLIVGMITRETVEELTLLDKSDNQITIPKNLIATRSVQRNSPMPNNYRDLLTESQIQNLLAYLMELTGVAGDSRPN